MLIVVSYDIPSDRRRTKLANALKDFGQRVQYSVFECRLDAEELDLLRRRLLRLVDNSEDSLRFYVLCGACVERVEVHGEGEVVENPDVYIV